MPNDWPQWVQVAAAFAVGAALAVGVVVLLAGRWRRQNDPDEWERQRRLEVNRRGRIVAGEVVDIVDEETAPNGARRRLIHYRYTAGAVDYAACQDVTMIADLIGDDPRGIVGTVSVKHHQNNPYDSIIACETWSGLRRNNQAAPEGTDLAEDPAEVFPSMDA